MRMLAMNATVRGMAAVFGAILAIGWTGCTGGGGDFELAPTKGRVTVDGQPVKGGSITFRPVASEGTMAGKPAAGEVKDDGTFVLTTHEPGDGAVVGKHKVLFTPIYIGATSYEDVPEPSPYAGMVPKSEDVEIKSGQNDITVELVPRG